MSAEPVIGLVRWQTKAAFFSSLGGRWTQKLFRVAFCHSTFPFDLHLPPYMFDELLEDIGGQVVMFQQRVLQFQALLQKYILPSYITWFRKCLTSWWYTWYSLLPDCGTLEYAFVHNNSIRASSLLQIYLLRMPYLNLWFQWSHNQLGKHTAELY